MSIETREEWLIWAKASLYDKIFKEPGLFVGGQPSTTPEKIRLSCGFPIGSRGSKDKLGQCLTPKASASELTEIYVSPTINDAIEVLGIVHHEMIHAFIGVERGHGPEFKRLMVRTGLNGPAKRTTPKLETVQKYKEIVKALGDYPHEVVSLPPRGSKGSPLIKAMCDTKGCWVKGYTIRLTMKWLVTGMPICHGCNNPLQVQP